MKCGSVVRGVSAILGLSVAGIASADVIPVTNADFQSVFETGTNTLVTVGAPASNSAIRSTNAFGNNITLFNPNQQVDLPGWVNVTSQSGIENLGSQNNTGNSVGYNAGVNDTLTGYVGTFNPGSNLPSAFKQTLLTNLIAGQTYTLSVEVFRRNDQGTAGTGGGSEFPTSFAASLQAGATTLTPTGPATFATPAVGAESTYTISYNAADNTALLNQPLTILFSVGQGQANIDNVSLVSVPEPATVGALLLGGAGLLVRRRSCVREA